MDRRFPVLKGHLAGPGICKSLIRTESEGVTHRLNKSSRISLVEAMTHLEAVLASSSLPTSFFCTFDDTT